MKRKAVALLAAVLAASSIALGGGAAARASTLDEIADQIDLEALAELILMEYLGLNGDSEDNKNFALVIGFTFGVAFANDEVDFTEALSEGIVLTGSDPAAAAEITTLAETYAGPGLAAFYSGISGVAYDPGPEWENAVSNE